MNILVPTDFSEIADNAIEYAAMLAVRLQAKIFLLHVIPPRSVWWTTVDSNLISGARSKQEAIRKKLVDKGINPFDIGMHVISDFPITKYIDDLISEHKIDYVVMGTHGSSGLSRTKLGSFTMGMIDNVFIPVIAVPEVAKAEAISNILYATDLEDVLQETRKFLPLAKALGATIHIVHVPDDSVASEVLARHSLAEISRLAGYSSIATEVAHGEHLADVIDGQIESRNIDLLVMFAHRKGFFEKLFRGSRSEQMSSHTHIPLLVFRKPGIS